MLYSLFIKNVQLKINHHDSVLQDAEQHKTISKLRKTQTSQFRTLEKTKKKMNN